MGNMLDKAKEIQDWVLEQRRDFHRHPELSFKEYRTSQRIKEELGNMGIEVKSVGETGVVGLIKGKEGGIVLGLRADIDALPVTEDSDVPFASENAGIMHACGHDTHAAMLLGAAKLLSGMKDQFKGTVKLIFQPAEEAGAGAKAMIDAGALKDPAVDVILGMHIFGDLPQGKVVVQEGPLMASGDTWTLEVIGKQCHGSAPWQGVDANVCAVAIVQALQTIVSRVNDARLPIVINVGTIHGGERFNITSGKVTLEGMNRAFSQEVREKIPGWMERVIKGICEAYGCEYTFKYNFLVAVTTNEAGLTKKMRESVASVIGEENIMQVEKLMGSEDFSEYQLITKGGFMFLGGGNEEKGCVYPQHSNHFKIDEDALAVGVACYAQAALDFLK